MKSLQAAPSASLDEEFLLVNDSVAPAEPPENFPSWK
jgi:hypothetical protein